MNCKQCEKRTSIMDDELMDVVGYKCTITGTIISADVEDETKECEGNCPLLKNNKLKEL